MQGKSRQRGLVTRIKRDFDDKIRPEGFYLTKRDHRLVSRLIQHLHSPTPFGFIHAENSKFAEYYFELTVSRLHLMGKNSLISFESLKKRRLIDLLNTEIEGLSLENVSLPGGRDEGRKIVLVPCYAELSAEDWQDIETLCLELPGCNIGLLCGANPGEKSILNSERLARDMRTLHIHFGAPRPREKLILSAVARSSMRYSHILDILKQLDVYETSASDRTEVSDVKSDESANMGLFDGYLETAKEALVVDQEAIPTSELLPEEEKNSFGLRLGKGLLAVFVVAMGAAVFWILTKI
jgi:hypothetical protein